MLINREMPNESAGRSNAMPLPSKGASPASSRVPCWDPDLSVEAAQEAALDAAQRAGDAEMANLHMRLLMETGVSL